MTWHALKLFGLGVCSLAVLAIVGYLALCLVYTIPSSLVHDNVSRSADLLNSEELYPPPKTSVGGGYDNATEYTMLDESVGRGNPFTASLLCPIFKADDKSYALERSLEGETNYEYSRIGMGIS